MESRSFLLNMGKKVMIDMEDIKNKIKMLLLSIILVAIIILVYVIDRTKLLLLICPVIAGSISVYANYKKKLDFNIAVDLFLCSIMIVLFIYLQTILNYWVI